MKVSLKRVFTINNVFRTVDLSSENPMIFTNDFKVYDLMLKQLKNANSNENKELARIISNHIKYFERKLSIINRYILNYIGNNEVKAKLLDNGDVLFQNIDLKKLNKDGEASNISSFIIGNERLVAFNNVVHTNTVITNELNIPKKKLNDKLINQNFINVLFTHYSEKKNNFDYRLSNYYFSSANIMIEIPLSKNDEDSIDKDKNNISNDEYSNEFYW